MFVPDGPDAVIATLLTQGPWDSNAQYGGTPAALLTWAVERVPTLVPMRIARITVDMHRPVPLGRLGVETEIVRQGKRLQIVVALLRDQDGVEVARATALRFRTRRVPTTPAPIRCCPRSRPRPSARCGHRTPAPRAATGSPGRSRPATEATGARPRAGTGPPVRSSPGRSPRRRCAWRGRRTSPPTAATSSTPTRWSAINADLTINLARVPVGEWTGVTTRAWYVEDGIGLARADLFDLDGYVGTCTAALLVDEVAAPYPS